MSKDWCDQGSTLKETLRDYLEYFPTNSYPSVSGVAPMDTIPWNVQPTLHGSCFQGIALGRGTCHHVWEVPAGSSFLWACLRGHRRGTFRTCCGHLLSAACLDCCLKLETSPQLPYLPGFLHCTYPCVIWNLLYIVFCLFSLQLFCSLMYTPSPEHCPTTE